MHGKNKKDNCMKVITLKKHHQFKKSTLHINKHINNQHANLKDHHRLLTNPQERQLLVLPLVDKSLCNYKSKNKCKKKSDKSYRSVFRQEWNCKNIQRKIDLTWMSNINFSWANNWMWLGWSITQGNITSKKIINKTNKINFLMVLKRKS